MFAGGQNEIQAKIKFLNNKTERKSSRVSY